jgi:signal-transduction protein with cAMP-binding, CBS, and nucleotidyltransferase domain
MWKNCASARVAGVFRRATYVLFQQRDAGDGLYGILEGRVTFSVDSMNGKELILNVLSPGEFFGEIALLDDKERTATAVAVEPEPIMVDLEEIAIDMPSPAKRIERRGARQDFRR